MIKKKTLDNSFPKNGLLWIIIHKCTPSTLGLKVFSTQVAYFLNKHRLNGVSKTLNSYPPLMAFQAPTVIQFIKPREESWQS